MTRQTEIDRLTKFLQQQAADAVPSTGWLRISDTGGKEATLDVSTVYVKDAKRFARVWVGDMCAGKDEAYLRTLTVRAVDPEPEEAILVVDDDDDEGD